MEPAGTRELKSHKWRQTFIKLREHKMSPTLHLIDRHLKIINTIIAFQSTPGRTGCWKTQEKMKRTRTH
jgi:hypothetical protein